MRDDGAMFVVERLAEAIAFLPWTTFPEPHNGTCTVMDHYRAGAERIAREYAALAAQENQEASR